MRHSPLPKNTKYKPGLISFIVSAYDRPDDLLLALASICRQTEPHEIIVCSNHPSVKVLEQHKTVARQFGAKVYHTGKWGAYCCYSSAEMVIAKGIPRGEFLNFASDDSIYFTGFSDLMMRAARLNNWDLVYCDCVYDPLVRIERGSAERYGILKAEPRLNKIDKTNFILKASWFEGFPGKRRSGPAAADALLIEELIARGIRHGKADGHLLVHQ